MDTDETYIKMVLALPKSFFKGWKWQAGDKAILNADEYGVYSVLVLHSPENCITRNPEVIDVIISAEITSNGPTSIVINNLRPLPSQEQLQKIAINADGSNDFRISKRFIARVIEGCGDIVDDAESKTLNVMWLEFTVNLVLHKRWNGYSWVDDNE